MVTHKTKVALLWSKHGGSTTSVNDLVVSLDRSRFDVMCIYLCGHRTSDDLFEKAGHEVIYLTEKRRLQFFSLRALFRLVRILKQHRVDILHCHTHTPAFYGAIATSLAGTPVMLSHVHGLGRTRNLKRRLGNLVVFRRAAKVLCVAEAVRQDVIKTNWRMDPDKLVVLENSVDYERFAGVRLSHGQAKSKLGLSADDFVFGTVGRLAPTKGLSYLLDAFSIVKQQIPSAHLVLLGDGPSRVDLEQQAMQLPCCQAIHFLGHRPGIAELFQGLDVFVLSSVAEGMPRALLEAMAGGIPCVATAVGGVPEVFRQSDAEFLVPAGDAASLAQKMIRVARMTVHQRAAIGAAAQERIRRFYSHAVVREKLQRVYEGELEACESHVMAHSSDCEGR